MEELAHYYWKEHRITMVIVRDMSIYMDQMYVHHWTRGVRFVTLVVSKGGV